MTDREKLIARLREIASLTPPICQYDRPFEFDVMDKKITAYCKPFEQFQDLLREAADALANGVVVREWIPVTERLPEEQGYYLVAHQRSGCVAERFYYRDCPDLFVEVTGDPVTHWMPLPEPPMRKGENG